MTDRRTAAIVLAAGHGTRMKSAIPKVLHPLAGVPMIAHILRALEDAGVGDICVVVGPGMDTLAAAVQPHATAIQEERHGTAHAALCARDALSDTFDDLLILNGDNPLIPSNDISALLESRAGADDPAVVVLGFRSDTPGAYGRMIIDADGHLQRIVEAKDASPEELAIDICSSGMMALDGGTAFDMLSRISNDNAQAEYYLPDIVGVARGDGRVCATVTGDQAALLGINSRAELATAEATYQDRARRRMMDAGVTLIDPSTVYFAADTDIAADVLIEPNVFFGPGVTIGAGTHIKAFSHIEGTTIGSNAIVGPYARLRPGTELSDGVKIGNFVETKAAVVAEGAKINHLSYVGDAVVGVQANIGAGTITCNYDGVFKWQTKIGAGAFIGSNTALVAPVSIGDGAVVGAGSTVSSDVSADALAVVRAKQREIADWARKTRERKKELKAKGEKG